MNSVIYFHVSYYHFSHLTLTSDWMWCQSVSSNRASSEAVSEVNKQTLQITCLQHYSLIFKADSNLLTYGQLVTNVKGDEA